MNLSHQRLSPQPAENFGWLRYLAVVLLASALVYPGLRYRFFREFFGSSAQESSSYAFLQGLSLLGGVLVAAIVSSIWNRRARSVRAGAPAAGLWPAARPLVFSVGIVVTAIGLLYAIENWRGARAWAAVEATLRAKGERMDIVSLIRPPLPDEENFAATPLFKAAYTLVPTTEPRRSVLDATFHWNASPEAEAARKRLGPLTTLEPINPRTNSLDGRVAGRLPNGRLDLAQFAASLRANTNYHLSGPSSSPAAELLDKLGQRAADLSEIAAAARRPSGRFDTHPEDLYSALLPSVAPLKGLSRTFMVRSAAHLATGDRDGAFTDLMTATRLGETLRDEYFAITQLVRLAIHAQSPRAFAEGLAEHAWTEAQLREYQEYQSSLSFRDGLLRAIRAEQIAAQLSVDALKRDRASVWMFDRLLSSDSESQENDALVLFYFCPDGWFDQNRTRLVTYYQAVSDQVRKSKTEALPSQAVDDLLTQMKVAGNSGFQAYSYFVGRLATAMKGVLARVNQAEARQRLAITACALERYWLRHRSYPTALSELVPDFLPQVPLDLMHPEAPKAPLTYRRTDDGWYVLYSFGENRKDDHGVYRAKLRDGLDLDCDWVWPVPVGEGRRMF